MLTFSYLVYMNSDYIHKNAIKKSKKVQLNSHYSVFYCPFIRYLTFIYVALLFYGQS